MTTLTTIIAEALRLDEAKVTDDLAIHSVATWNSLTHIELVIMIEEQLQIQLTEDEIVAMRSVGDIKKILAQRGVSVK